MRPKKTKQTKNPKSAKTFFGFFYVLFPVFLAGQKQWEKRCPVGRGEGFIFRG
jgi:hypothetical protein